jgi:hypothetical protein
MCARHSRVVIPEGPGASSRSGAMMVDITANGVSGCPSRTVRTKPTRAEASASRLWLPSAWMLIPTQTVSGSAGRSRISRAVVGRRQQAAPRASEVRSQPARRATGAAQVRLGEAAPCPCETELPKWTQRGRGPALSRSTAEPASRASPRSRNRWEYGSHSSTVAMRPGSPSIRTSASPPCVSRPAAAVRRPPHTTSSRARSPGPFSSGAGSAW